MKTLKFFTHQGKAQDDPVYHLGFEKYEDELGDYYLFMGDVYSALDSENYNDKRKIVLTLEEPNFCTGDFPNDQHVRVFNKADKVLTLCPYTAESTDNRECVFFPFNEECIPEEKEKEYDVIYTGSIQSPAVSQMVDCMLPHNYVFVNFGNDPRANFPKVSHEEKINLYSKTKVTICHNLLWPNPGIAHRYRAFTNSDKNKAFDLLDHGVMPQIKSRVFEAAFSKSIILCLRDPWNVIERYFEPGKHFIYYDGPDDLKENLNELINNFDNYKDMIESAYDHAVNNYTTKHFVDKFLRDI